MALPWQCQKEIARHLVNDPVRELGSQVSQPPRNPGGETDTGDRAEHVLFALHQQVPWELVKGSANASSSPQIGQQNVTYLGGRRNVSSSPIWAT